MQIPQANGGQGKGEEGKRLVTSEPKELLAGAWVICDYYEDSKRIPTYLTFSLLYYLTSYIRKYLSH